MKFPRENMIYRERHCPPEEEKLRCRDYVHYADVPYKSLTVEKAVQNWVQFQGNIFKFPGGGTMFPQGADAYIDELASVIPIADGSVRTAWDTGCGVASWGAYLLKRNVLAMSFAPRDNHEAQVQFALERGVPAVIGELGSIRLPYPARAFDMAQCSRCLIPWTANGKILEPGGYWIVSGPPINWKTYYKTWKRSKEDVQAEQKQIEALAESLCWEKKYKKMDTCVTPSPEVTNANEVAVGELKFPARLYAVPPRIANGLVVGINRLIGTTRYWNVMDMNAGLGGFAAALESRKLWVMNVVPTIAKNTFGVIYERGLIGIYHDWCEGFSTYPSSYDLIHASGVFSLYKNECKLEDILLEMDRILRPEGTVIFRDEVDVLNKVRKIVGGMRWDAKIMDHEDGPLVPEKILVVVKQYWVAGSGNSTSSDE
ncbi:methyltransferase PMT14 [Pyrus ussuriensis x Pyrus communis]|uniref:Methyltransferase n=1 Tax=Pyrus ussuriensis x Pyrus communis TaxID=2448454 RepID=A0A5N5G2T2_9ROSA|nr:methyltransferase PMT14 [Pyrus ussuriensis x Pyrus communis]